MGGLARNGAIQTLVSGETDEDRLYGGPGVHIVEQGMGYCLQSGFVR